MDIVEATNFVLQTAWGKIGDYPDPKNAGPRIIISAAPNTGSTYLHRLLSDFMNLPMVSVSFSQGRSSHELCPARMFTLKDIGYGK